MRRLVGMIAVHVFVPRDYIVSDARHDNLLKRILLFLTVTRQAAGLISTRRASFASAPPVIVSGFFKMMWSSAMPAAFSASRTASARLFASFALASAEPVASVKPDSVNFASGCAFAYAA